MSDVNQIISDPQIRINNETFAVVPNSIKVDLGLGDSKVMMQSAGNGSVSQVYSEDVTTKVGKVTLSVYATGAQVTAIKSLKANKNTNYISITDAGSELTLIMKNAALVKTPEINFSAEGQIELEFEGNPIQ